MGLKTSNYHSKAMGITLPNAYAVIKDLSVYGNYGKVTFAIQSSREAAQKLNPIEKVEIRFEWDRKKDIAKVAYETAKTHTTKYTAFDEEKQAYVEVETKGILYGWEDDIVE